MDYQEILMRFLTEQSLLPAQIARFFYSHPEIKPDIHFIADMLYNRDTFKPSGNNAAKDLLKILESHPFAGDAALSNWLQSVSKILEILKSKEIFDGIKIPQEQIRWALTVFVQSCPLVDNKTKEKYVAEIENQCTDNQNSQRKCFLLQQTNRYDFEKYMKQKFNFATATVTLYTSAINQISKKYGDNLWEIQDVESFNTILQKLFDNPMFCAEPQQKVRALNQYSLFLKYKNNKSGWRPITDGKANLHHIGTARQRDTIKDFDNNLVGFCFSCGHERLFPGMSQKKALELASNMRGINYNTLKNIMSYFDYYIKDNNRKGWPCPAKPASDIHKIQRQILDTYLTCINGKYYKNKNEKKLEKAYENAKNILGI